MNTPTASRPARRRAARIGAATALIAGLVLAAPLAAQAHVTVAPESGTAGSSEVITFAFSHGCDGSPTTGLRIEMPDGLASVSPTAEPGWHVELERDENDGLVSAVTFTAGEPIPNELRGAVSLGVRFSPDATGTLAFPVEQRCVEGAHAWDQLAEEGENPHDLDAPAPVVTLDDADDGGSDHSAGSGGAGHSGSSGSASGGSGGSGPGTSAESNGAAPTESTGAAAVGIGLGSAGLAAGIAALGIAFAALRRARR